MPKSFLLFVEDESVTGFQIMDMLKKLKCYHHVSDFPKLEAVEQKFAPDECQGCGAKIMLTMAFENGVPVCDACGTRR